MIRPYLSNIINDHKTRELRVHSSNEVIDYETLWRIENSINNVN